MLERGYVQIYTGDGKGKTTAALGLALRAAGAGFATLIIQFMKGETSSEYPALERFKDLITIEQYGSEILCEAGDAALEEHRVPARKGYARMEKALENVECSLLIADEIITATFFDLISVDEVLRLIKMKPPEMELVLTGRGAAARLIDAADLVTEMKEIKHYFNRNVRARRGIEY